MQTLCLPIWRLNVYGKINVAGEIIIVESVHLKQSSKLFRQALALL